MGMSQGGMLNELPRLVINHLDLVHEEIVHRVRNRA